MTHDAQVYPRWRLRMLWNYIALYSPSEEAAQGIPELLKCQLVIIPTQYCHYSTRISFPALRSLEHTENPKRNQKNQKVRTRKKLIMTSTSKKK